MERNKCIISRRNEVETIYQVGEMSLSLYAVGNDPVESEEPMTAE